MAPTGSGCRQRQALGRKMRRTSTGDAIVLAASSEMAAGSREGKGSTLSPQGLAERRLQACQATGMWAGGPCSSLTGTCKGRRLTRHTGANKL